MNGNSGVHGRHKGAVIIQSVLACQRSTCEAVDTLVLFSTGQLLGYAIAGCS